MANEVITAQTDLVAGSFYKIVGVTEIGATGQIGAFVKYQSDGSLNFIADKDANVKLPVYNEAASFVPKYFYKLIPQSMISDFTGARNALLNL